MMSCMRKMVMNTANNDGILLTSSCLNTAAINENATS